MGLNIRAGRIAAGAAAGALWACVSPFVVPEQGFQLMLAFGPVSVLMVYLAYRERRPKSLLHQAGGLYLTSALMSGGLSLLKRAVYGIASNGQKGTAQSCLLFLTLLSGAGFVCFSACFLWEAAGREKRLRSCRAETVLICKGRQIQVKAFLDTGNQLYDPIFRRPVSVIWEGALNGLFDGTEGTSLIPYRSVGRENGMLPAAAADGIRIELNGQKRYFKRPLIAVSKTPLSPDGSYGLLLHTEVWEQAVSLSPELCRKKQVSRNKTGGENHDHESRGAQPVSNENPAYFPGAVNAGRRGNPLHWRNGHSAGSPGQQGGSQSAGGAGNREGPGGQIQPD